MSTRLRKLIGSAGILAFLLLYVGLVVQAAQYVPDHGLWQAFFYLVAGLGWGVPILPLISWMNRGR
jgi:hypothetical protein